jgi:Family of unknown function (DUF6494)
MDEERFNISLRKLLKQFGVTAQREVERGVDDAMKAGTLQGTETLRARAVMQVEGLSGEVVVEGEIILG